jgi:hypothetical protein
MNRQKLIFRGQQLLPASRLAEYGIENDGDLVILLEDAASELAAADTQLTVTTVTGETFHLDVTPDTELEDVLARIESLVGTPEGQIALWFEAEEPETNARIPDPLPARTIAGFQSDWPLASDKPLHKARPGMLLCECGIVKGRQKAAAYVFDVGRNEYSELRTVNVRFQDEVVGGFDQECELPASADDTVLAIKCAALDVFEQRLTISQQVLHSAAESDALAASRLQAITDLLSSLGESRASGRLNFGVLWHWDGTHTKRQQYEAQVLSDKHTMGEIGVCQGTTFVMQRDANQPKPVPPARARGCCTVS